MSKSIERCLALLELLCRNDAPQSFSEISRKLGNMSHASLTRLLKFLLAKEYVVKNPVNGRYGPGPAMNVFLHFRHQNQTEMLIAQYATYMDYLARHYDITVILLERMKQSLVNIKKCQTEISPHMQNIGTINVDWDEPWIQTLAAYDPDLEKLFSSHPEYPRLATIREQGFYYDNMEKRKTFRRLCFPIFTPGEAPVTALLGIGGNILQLTDETVKRLIPSVKEKLAELARSSNRLNQPEANKP